MFRRCLSLLFLLTVVPLSVDARCLTHRSQAVRRQFQRLHPCPSTGLTRGVCPGWVRDHIIPLCLCTPNLDSVGNLQWMEVAAAKIKDTHERAQCRLRQATP